MIDALEAIINLALVDSGLQDVVGDHIAAEHKFGTDTGDWKIPSKALTFRWDGGTPDIYTERMLPRIEARCYGESFAEANKVHKALVPFVRSTNRKVVSTSTGEAFVYWLVKESEPSMMIDPDTHVPLLLVFLSAAVAENEIGG